MREIWHANKLVSSLQYGVNNSCFYAVTSNNCLFFALTAVVLENFEQFKLCDGVAVATANINVHHLQRWDEKSLHCRTIMRSPNCKCIGM